MEQELYERDRVGLQDQVLLEDYQSEDAFIDNLKKRFKENLIYVSFSLCKFQLKFWIFPLDFRPISDKFWSVWILTRNCRFIPRKWFRCIGASTFLKRRRMCEYFYIEMLV